MFPAPAPGKGAADRIVMKGQAGEGFYTPDGARGKAGFCPRFFCGNETAA
jgi:hypothetical protein